jgi:hypothetical protein
MTIGCIRLRSGTPIAGGAVNRQQQATRPSVDAFADISVRPSVLVGCIWESYKACTWTTWDSSAWSLSAVRLWLPRLPWVRSPERAGALRAARRVERSPGANARHSCCTHPDTHPTQALSGPLRMKRGRRSGLHDRCPSRHRNRTLRATPLAPVAFADELTATSASER